MAALEPPPGRGGRQWLGSLPRHNAGVGIPKSHCQVTRSTAILAHSIPSPSSHGSAMARTGRKSLIHTKSKMQGKLTQVPVYPLDYRPRSSVRPSLTRAWWLSATEYVAALEPPPGRGGRQWLGNLPQYSAGVGIPKSHCQVTRSTTILAHSIPSPSSHGSAMARTGRKSLIHTQPNKLTQTHVLWYDAFAIHKSQSFRILPDSANIIQCTKLIVLYL